MVDAAQFKRWKVSEALLRRAHAALPVSAEAADTRVRELDHAFFEYLEHNEHELALDMLQDLGDLLHPRGGFWKDLIRAAENMGLAHRVAYFTKQYHEALSRLSSDESKA